MILAKEPEQIELTPKQMEALRDRVSRSELTAEDRITLLKVLAFFVWMQNQVARCRLTVKKLRNIIFGGKTEKSKTQRPKKENPAAGDNNDGQSSAESSAADAGQNESANDSAIEKNNLPAATDETKPKAKGHGRTGADEYVPDEIIHVSHTTLKPGDICPTKCGGRLYRLDAGAVIRVSGQSCAHVARYEFERLRCALCNEVFRADPPPGFSEDKYDARFKADLVMQKYFMASPFHRIEQHQKLMGFHLPDSTQWDLAESVADCAYPVLGALEKTAANGTNINNDDTRVKILDVIRDNKLNPDKKRKGMFTTCLLAQSAEGYQICLYYSGIRHSGENLASILEKRDKDLPPIIQMCDALAANIPSVLKTIVCNCLTHGRRRFTDIESCFPVECGYVISQLAVVYKHDADAKEKNMTTDERLAYHATHSAPVMTALKIWMQKQLDERRVEPNSALGGAIGYMQNHWAELTRFLSVSGAHLDNNIVERALKLAIRTRKNAMFHKTLHGALIAGLFLSLIETCALAGKNPVHYLTALQENRQAVRKNPEKWLPWHYESSLIDASSSEYESGQSAA